MIDTILYLIVLLIVGGLAWWLVQQLPLPAPIPTVITVLVILILLIVLFTVVVPLSGHLPLFR
jgi:hypothetical protein